MDIFLQLFVILAYFTSLRRLVRTEKTYWWRAVLEQRYPLKRDNFFARYMKDNPSQQNYLTDGARIAVKECLRLFKYNRWNCKTDIETGTARMITTKPFGRIVEIGCRETAFIYAITSAGLVFNMIRACSQGKIDGCSNRCSEADKNNHLKATRLLNKTHSTNNECNDNFQFGINVWNNFVFKSETSSDIRARFNVRNSQVGMQDVIYSTELVCRCHGVSGSCVINICSQKVASHFKIIGQKVYDRYVKAQYEVPDQKEIEGWTKHIIKQHDEYVVPRRPIITSRRAARVPRNQPRLDLVPNLEFYQDSPDFCVKSPYGIGTTNRQCKPYVSDVQQVKGERSCDDICCHGRGTKTVNKIEQSNCRFVYCCEVVCDEKRKLTEEFFCL